MKTAKIEKRDRDFWSNENCILEARKHQTKKQFYKADNYGYRLCIERGLQSLAFSHFRPTGFGVAYGNYARRCVYLIYKGNLRYVGITLDLKQRIAYHRDKNKSLPKDFKYKKLTDYIELQEATKIESRLIDTYGSNPKFELVNKSKGGEIGGCGVMHTKKEVLEFAKTCKCRTEFWDNDQMRRSARRLGIKDLVKSIVPKKMPGKASQWNEVSIRKVALNYKTRGQFGREQYSASDMAKKLGIFESVCSHMKPTLSLYKKSKWTKKEIFIAAKKCSKRSEFSKKYQQAYYMAKRLGVFDEACAHMQTRKQENN